MRVVCISKPRQDYSSAVYEWLGNIERLLHKEVEVIDPDTKDGAHFAATYDITLYPTVLALDNNGSVIESWRGLPLPPLNSVHFYLLGEKS